MLVPLHGTGPQLLGVAGDHLPAMATGALAPLLLIGWWRLSPRLRPASMDRLAALALSVTAGLHLGLAAGHAGSDAPLAVLFAIDAGGLGLLALGAGRLPGWRPLAAVTLAANVLAYGAYVAGGKEAVDGAGSLSKLVELVGLGLTLAPRRGGTWGWSGAAAVLIATTVLGGTLGWAGILRDHAGADEQLAAAPPTAAQRAEAFQFAQTTWQQIQPFADWSYAQRAGYRATTPIDAATFHAENPRYLAAAKRSGRLDPAHPPALVYATTRRGPVLLGAMFEVAPGVRPEDFGGAATGWHSHPNLCLSPLTVGITGLLTPFGNCPPLSLNWISPPMLHVWSPAMPGGPFGELDPRWLAAVRAGSVSP